jgi:hypothetical protein
MSDATDVLETRLVEIEKKVRRLELARWSTMMGLVLLAISWLISAAVRNPGADVRWLSVHDRDDRLRGWFDEEGVQLKDASGHARLKLGLYPDGSPYLQFFDREQRLRSHLSMYPPDGSMRLWFADKEGKWVIYPPNPGPMP